MKDLEELAKLLERRSAVDSDIAKAIGRRAEKGHIGEYIASRIFGIRLHASASTKGSDGVFTTGPLAGMTVNVKWYTTDDSGADLPKSSGAKFMLVFSGGGPTGEGPHRPLTIDSVYIFDEAEIMGRLRERGVKIGPSASVRNADWEEAEVYPVGRSPILRLTEDQRRSLELFRGRRKRGEDSSP